MSTYIYTEKIKYDFHADKRKSMLDAELRLINAGLSEHYGTPSGEVKLLYTSNGKPYLSGESMPFISITNKHDYVMTALSDIPVGIDMEIPDSALTVEKACRLSNRFLLPLEAKAVMEAGPAMFYRIWTFKESYTKAYDLKLPEVLGSVSYFDKLAHVEYVETPEFVYSVYSASEQL